MVKASKLSYQGALFLGLASFIAYHSSHPISYGFAWLGSIQLFNAAAIYLPPPIAGLIHWVHAMTFEFLAFSGAIFLRFLPRKNRVPGKKRPVLLVHGYIHSAAVWVFHMKRLEALGLGPIYTIDLGSSFSPIEFYAKKIKMKVEAIAKDAGRKDVILIGHSMGGLVSALYATTLAPPGTVTDVITIASPWAGTPLARFAIGVNAREMEPDSEFLKKLKSNIAKHKEIRFAQIATTRDEIVIPGDSAALDHCDHFILDDVGHVSLLYSQRVSKKLVEWVNN